MFWYFPASQSYIKAHSFVNVDKQLATTGDDISYNQADIYEIWLWNYGKIS